MGPPEKGNCPENRTPGRRLGATAFGEDVSAQLKRVIPTGGLPAGGLIDEHPRLAKLGVRAPRPLPWAAPAS